ncbi:MAG TPA: VCBS repeat-containing protein [Longimicrobiales bacterium]
MPKSGGEEHGGRAPPRMFGLVEITISGLGTGEVTSSALSAPTVEALERVRAERKASGAAGRAAPGGLAPQDFTLPAPGTGGGDGTIELEPLSTGSFTDGARGSGGVRYLYATYRVRNAPDGGGTGYNTSRRNLTFYAVDTDGTIDQTAISSLSRFDGSPADSARAAQFIPTGAVAKDATTDAIAPTNPDVLQALAETEADAIQAVAGSAGVTVDDVFPYGFVVRNPSDPTSRTLPPSPAPGQFDGIVTFAFKVPLQATAGEDPFTVSALFLAMDDDEVKLTQSVEEQTPAGRLAFDARADALEAEVLTLLPPAGDAMLWGGETPRVFCQVRVAGPASSPTATLFPTPGAEPWLPISPLRPGFQTLPRTVRLAVARCPGVVSPGPSTFAVHGFQSGRPGLTDYGGVGMSLVFAAGPGGDFFPGEEVEVTVTTGVGASAPIVARYRVAASDGSGTFVGGMTYGVGDGSRSVVLGDLNGDGDLDMAMANWVDTTVSVLLNQGNGSFGSLNQYSVGATTPWSVASGDVDGDGALDLVTANVFSDTVSVLLNDGDGGFGPPTTYSVGDSPGSVALGDVDGDGDLDLVVTNAGDNSVSVLSNQGDGSFVGTPAATYGVDTGPASVALGDLDGDGALDLAVTADDVFPGTPDDVSVLSNQ